MKFTKENLRERIATDLGGSRKLSDRSINEMIDTMIQFAGEDTELDAFFAQVKPAFVTANGNLINEQSAFVKKWNEEHPGQQTQQTNQTQQNQQQFAQQGLTAEDVAAIVQKSLQPFAETFGKFQAEKTTEQLFEEAREKFLSDNKPDAENERVKAVIDRVNRTIKPTVKADSDVASIVSAMKNEFEDLASIAGITAPYIPVQAGGGSAGAEGTPEFYKSQRDTLSKEGFIKGTPGA